MESQELLPEDESARRAGVTVSTLRQFADFGFLSRFEENGEGRYRVQDLVSVFSLTEPLAEQELAAEPAPSEISSEPAQTFSDREFQLWTDSGMAAATAVSAADVSSAPIPQSMQTPDTQDTHFAEEPVRLAEQIEVTDSQHGEYNNYQTNYHAERDDRLGTTYELLALNKRLREELKAAREERDWLRARLEKLEARTERDQMLLLAESQTIRQLVTQVEKEKRSIWSLLALPWSGSSSAK